MTLSRDGNPKVLMACPTYSGMAYSLKQWAEAYHAQTYPNRGALQIDNSDGPAHGGNLHYAHCIRGQDIEAIWQTVRFPHLWDTLELSWRLLIEHAHAHGYAYIFSVEADVIVPPNAMEVMLDAAYEHGNDKPAVISQRYHPRGQAGPNFWWDTLGCSLFPVGPLYEDLNKVKAIYEIEVYITLERHGYVRYRPGHDGPDLFIPEHLKDPDDPLKQLYGASPAPTRYLKRVVDANKKKRLEGQPAALAKETVVEQVAPAAEAEVTIPMGSDAVRERPPELLPHGADLAKPHYEGRRVHEDAKPLDSIRHEKEALATVIHEDRIRLNVGSGYQQISGFMSVDFDDKLNPDVVAPIDDLPFEDDSVDEIYASHVLEHVPMQCKALEEWLRVLKPGGMLTVAVPDVVQVYYLYKHGGTWGEYGQPINENYINAVAFGANLLADEIPEMKDQYGGPGHRHQQIFIHDMLLNRVIAAGFVHAHEVSVCFLRKSALGETMVQAQKPLKGE